MRLVPETNPRQRRGSALVLLGVAGAAAAYLSVHSYVEEVTSRVEPLTPALQLVTRVGQYRRIEAQQVRTVLVPRRWLSSTTLAGLDQVGGLVASTPLEAGSYLQSDMLAPPPRLGPGQRASVLSLPADSVVAEVAEGSRVDVLAALDKSRSGGRADSSRVVVNAALVLGVTRPSQDGRTLTRSGGDAVTVTLALTAQESQALAWAQGLATRVGISLVGPGSPTLGAADRVWTQATPAPPRPARKPIPPGSKASAGSKASGGSKPSAGSKPSPRPTASPSPTGADR